jgi:hypothetical protein
MASGHVHRLQRAGATEQDYMIASFVCLRLQRHSPAPFRLRSSHWASVAVSGGWRLLLTPRSS